MKKLLALFLLSPLVVSDEKSYDELSSNKATAVNIETGESFYVSGVLQVKRILSSSLGDWLVKLGASIEHGKVDDTDSKTDVLVFTEIKYRLN